MLTKLCLRLGVLWVLLCSSASVMAQNDFLPVDEAFALSWKYQDQELLINWQVAPGYYLYDKRLQVQGSDFSGDELSRITRAELTTDAYFGESKVYRQQLQTRLPVKGDSGEVTVSYQGCADAGLCYPPQKRVISWPQQAGGTTATVAATAAVATATPAVKPDLSKLKARLNSPEPAAVAPAAVITDETDWYDKDLGELLSEHSLGVTLLVFFALGLGLTFTPCVLPMLPILSAMVVGQQDQSRKRALFMSLSYVQGMALVYAAAGLITASLGAAGNIQAAMQQPWILILFAVFFAVLACAMFGLFELQLPAFIRDRLATAESRQGLTGVFVMGAVSALVVSPCVTAPLAGALLYVSASGDLVSGGLALYVMALGMGFPLILVTTLGAKWLPRAGNWMNTVKAVFGVLLLMVSLWLLGRLWSGNINLLVWGGFMVMVAVGFGVMDSAQGNKPRLLRGGLVVLLLWGSALLIGGFMGNQDMLRPLASSAPVTAEKTVAKTVLQQRARLDQVLAASQGQQPVLVKVAADWCVSCEVMEQTVFADSQVRSALQGVKVISFDVTENSQGQQAWLKQYGIFGPPALVWFSEQGDTTDRSVLIGETDAAGFLRYYAGQI